VFSRLMLVSAEQLELYEEWVYVAALWLPVIACAVAAEFFAGPRLWSASKGSRHEETAHVPVLDAVR
jgi:hypothetical protein